MLLSQAPDPKGKRPRLPETQADRARQVSAKKSKTLRETLFVPIGKLKMSDESMRKVAGVLVPRGFPKLDVTAAGKVTGARLLPSTEYIQSQAEVLA